MTDAGALFIALGLYFGLKAIANAIKDKDGVTIISNKDLTVIKPDQHDQSD